MRARCALLLVSARGGDSSGDRVDRDRVTVTVTVMVMMGTVRARGARLRMWAGGGEGTRFLLLLALALAVRLCLAPYGGFFGDPQIYAAWGLSVRDHFGESYSLHSSGFTLANYPPLTMYLMGAVVTVYGWLAGLAGVHPSYDPAQSPAFAAFLKLPEIAAELAIAALIYALARRAKGQRWALLVAGAYAFAPPVLMDGALWGQTDGIYTLPLLLAFVAAWRRRPALAGALFAITVLLKPHPAVLGALLVVYLWRWAGARAVLRFSAGGAATGFAIVLPYLLQPRPQLLAFFDNLRYWSGQQAPHATNEAFNLWWLLGPGLRLEAARPYLGPLSPTMVGWLLFVPIGALAAYGVWHNGSLGRLFVAAGLAQLAFFDLTTLQHERYLYPALALFLIAAIHERRAAFFAVAVGAGLFLNMSLMVALYEPRTDLQDHLAQIGLAGELLVLATLLIAALNLALLVYAAGRFGRDLGAVSREAQPMVTPGKGSAAAPAVTDARA